MDRRILKTKKAIKEAYLKLLREKKDYRKINVKELVDAADVNRSTFYLHYYDINVVFEELIDEMFTEISSKIDKSDLTLEEMEKIINQMTAQIEGNSDYALIVSAGNEYPYFADAMLKMMTNKISMDSIKNPRLSEEDKQLLLVIIAKTTCDITSYLIRHYDAEKISKYFALIREYIFTPSIQKIMAI